LVVKNYVLLKRSCKLRLALFIHFATVPLGLYAAMTLHLYAIFYCQIPIIKPIIVRLRTL
jgi:hypothetical protein